MSDWILIPVKVVARNPGPSIGGLIFLIIILSITGKCSGNNNNVQTNETNSNYSLSSRNMSTNNSSQSTAVKENTVNGVEYRNEISSGGTHGMRFVNHNPYPVTIHYLNQSGYEQQLNLGANQIGPWWTGLPITLKHVIVHK